MAVIVSPNVLAQESKCCKSFCFTANYVKHEGSKPMNITWKLDKAVPAKFLKKTNKLVVG